MSQDKSGLSCIMLYVFTYQTLVMKHKYAARSTFRVGRISSWRNKLWEKAIWISRSTCTYILSTFATCFVILTAGTVHVIRFIYHENIVRGSFISTIFKERKIAAASSHPFYVVFLSCFSCFIPDPSFRRPFRRALSRAVSEAVHVSSITAHNSFFLFLTRISRR